MDINRSENRSCFYHEILLSSRQIKFLVPLDVGCFLKPISCLLLSILPACQCCDFVGFQGESHSAYVSPYISILLARDQLRKVLVMHSG